MKDPFIRSHHNYDSDAASTEAAYVETMPSLTIQSQTEDTDLNVIMKRFGVTGVMPPNFRTPQYGDYDGINNFADAWNAVKNAEDNFMQIPAEIRAQFQNDPQLFLEFCANPDNLPTMVSMGLAKEKAPTYATGPGPAPTGSGSTTSNSSANATGNHPATTTTTGPAGTPGR